MWEGNSISVSFKLHLHIPFLSFSLFFLTTTSTYMLNPSSSSACRLLTNRPDNFRVKPYS